MLLYIVRHAWAGSFDPAVWPDDFFRPLTPKGERRFQCVTRRLATAGCRPQLIATSPLVRCRQTAEILATHLPGQPPLVELDLLAPGATLEPLLHWTREQKQERLAWVGHAPDVGFLAAALIGEGAADLRFAKGACAAIELDASATAGKGRLNWLATAKLVGC